MFKLLTLGFLCLAHTQCSNANEKVGDADWPHTPITFSSEIGSHDSFNEFLDCSGWKHAGLVLPKEKYMYLGFDKKADGKKELSFSAGHLNHTSPPFELGVEFEETLLGGKAKSIVVHSPPESRYRIVLTQRLEGTTKTIEHVFVGNNRFMHVECKCCKDHDSNCIHMARTFEHVK